eukprot:TRINITY_DN11108_c0_g1_i1.p1 TRINITY_DN11108_c0_g1~~TRINITY_DN11108_c0_g1_i1.p1  ORF type:complete len:185 (+),score=50.16 TRINITY_DN11108_c0_g1_i1:44-598(+)
MSLIMITVIGAGHVGKSAVTVRFVSNTFVDKYNATIEDSYRKQIEIDGQAMVLEIFDTAGQEEYSALRDQYLQKSDGVLLIYSITSKHTFDTCPKSKVNIERLKLDHPNFPMVLVGNKVDLEGERQVSTAAGKELADKWGVPFFETSALKTINILECFTELVRIINKQDRPSQRKPKKKPCLIL